MADPSQSAARPSLLLLLLLGLFSLTRGQTPAEQSALAQFYQTITFKSGLSWNTNNPLCGQEGVICSGGVVTQLSLSSKLTGGSISSHIGQLPNLLTLDLRGNSLTGTIPTEVGNMSSLRNLRLATNTLTGSIPTQIGNMKTLQTINMQSNRLSGTVPSELEGLTLSQLYLGVGNYFCPRTDYSTWATATDSPSTLTCTACGASFPLCPSDEVCLGGLNELFTCSGAPKPILIDTESLELAPDQAANIQVSLGSSPQGTVTVNLDSNCALLSPCSLSFDSTNFATPQTVTVTMGTFNPATVCYVRASTDGDTYVADQVEILQPDEPSRWKGIIHGDPSVVTFSNTRFQVPGTGFYTLLQAADGQFAVQVRTDSCENKGICTFGLTIQKGTFVATLSMDMDGALTQQTTGNASTSGVILLTQSGRHRFHLTTGLRITARAGFTPTSQQYSLMVVVSASSSYKNQLAGLFGSFSGVKNGDMLLPDGTFTADATAFAAAWEVDSDSENLFLSYPAPIAISPVSGVTPFDPSSIGFGCRV